MEEVEKRLVEKFQQAWDASSSTLGELSKKMDGLSLLTTKLSEMEKRQMENEKLVQYLQSKMDLSMKSLAQVAQDQSRLASTVSNAVSGMTESARTATGDGLMGPGPPPIPLRNAQVLKNTPPITSMHMGNGNNHSDMDTRVGPEMEAQGRKSWLPKLEFPFFDGEDVRVWMDNCESYFEMYQIPAGLKVCAASMHLKGKAALWFQASRDYLYVLSWDQFKGAVMNEFEANSHSDRMLELLTLRQSGSVIEYKNQFDKLAYHIKLFDRATSETFLVTQFVLGLKNELRMNVEVQFPQTVAMAAQLALKYEGWQVRQSSGGKRFTTVKANPSLSIKESGESQGELWKARQLKEYRRSNGLCFKCREKYIPGHKCKTAGIPQLNCISVDEGGDGGPLLSDEVLDFLESSCGNIDDEMVVSLNALSGTEHSRCIRIKALIQNQMILQLLDSGSSNTFISELASMRIQCETQEISPVNIKVANGQTIVCNKKAVQLEWWCSGKTFVADAIVLPQAAYDMVIGMDWLEKFSPMLCDWDKKWVEFRYHGEMVKLQGLIPGKVNELQETSCEQVIKWHKGNEVWVVAMLQRVSNQEKEETDLIPPCIQKILDQFKGVFKTPDSLPPAREYDHTITLLSGASPVNLRPYRYSPLQKDEIERQVQEMLHSGIIARSVSPFASPVLLVKKKDGNWRFCVDYRRLNDITVKNKFPMPVIDEFLDELAGSKYFSKLDMASGFHQIRMAEKDEVKTAFKTHHGHFQFRVMPFGLTNAPATFQCLMNVVFQKLMRKCVLIFMDDILVYSPTLEEHATHLQQVFQTLQDQQLYAKRSKCSFAVRQIDYLGHVISENGVATDPGKTVSISKWPVPSSHTELRGFLGLTGYYRKFVKGYGMLAKPLTSVLQQKQFSWSSAAQTAFEELKAAMMTTPVLALPDFDKEFVIETDACDRGIGAVLSQNGHPIAFYSKALGVKNSKLSTYEKEFLAILMAVDKWRCYLQRGSFVIRSDHKSLSHLQDQSLATDLQKKAMTKLAGLQFTVQYKKGAENKVADALSRVAHCIELSAISTSTPIWIQEVINSYELDTHAQELLQELAIQSPNTQGFSLQNGLIYKQQQLMVGQNVGLHTINFSFPLISCWGPFRCYGNLSKT